MPTTPIEDDGGGWKAFRDKAVDPFTGVGVWVEREVTMLFLRLAPPDGSGNLCVAVRYSQRGLQFINTAMRFYVVRCRTLVQSIEVVDLAIKFLM